MMKAANRQKLGNGMRKRFLIVCMALAGILLLLSGRSVQAADARIDLVETQTHHVGDTESGTKWAWNKGTLTLEDGFSLTYTGEDGAAIRLPADAKVVLKGTATITSSNKGIETLGNLTIKSAKNADGSYAKGVLKIETNRKGNATLGKFYGIEIRNPEGLDGMQLHVTDQAILEVYGTGDGSLFCSASSTAASNQKAALHITGQGAVQLRHATSVAAGFQIKENGERLLRIINDSPVFMKESDTYDLSGKTNITLLAGTIEGTADNAAVTNYTLTYDGIKHPICFNPNEAGLHNLGTPIDPIKVHPVDFKYYDSLNSDYLQTSGSDYREKDVVETTTQYEDFTAATKSPLYAAPYEISYNNTIFATLQIKQREVTITGLKAVDKTYDGWKDAKIDYADMQITCVNNTGSVNGATQGIVTADEAKLGTEIIPYAKAFFVTEMNSSTGSDFQVLQSGATYKYYKKSEDVAYDGEGSSALKTVATKTVLIDNGVNAVTGVATGVTLSDPNYKVVVPSKVTTNKSQIEASAKIYPRALTDAKVTCSIDPTSVKWREAGYLEERDITKTITDKSPITSKHSDYEKTLKQGEDYLVNPNTNTITEVGSYQIIMTGQNNYTGTVKRTWTIERAVRRITITENNNRAYDGNRYEIKTGEGGFTYKIEDISYPAAIDITGKLEEGSNLKITYSKKKEDGTFEAESLQAPKDAGTYKVTISVDETTRYTAAAASKEFTIYPRVIKLDWYCKGGSVEETEANPTALVYNGARGVFTPVVTNAVEGESVKVASVVYNGTVLDGTAYINESDAPKEAGSYTVAAAALQGEDPNYTLEGTATSPAIAATPAHSYSIAQKEATVSWNLTEAQKTVIYDGADHTPALSQAVVGQLCTGDTCTISDYALSGLDVKGASYTKAGGAKNACQNGSSVTITATALSNKNYKLPEAASCRDTFTILPFDLSAEDTQVGTYDAHEGMDIWAAKLSYTGTIQEPSIMWQSANGPVKLQKSETDYNGYKATGLSTQALEYNENGLRIEIEGVNNFKGKTTIPWNVEKLTSSVTIDNYAAVQGTPYTITYGQTPDAVVFSYENEDIKKNLEVGVNPFISYHFTGTMANGETYDETVEADALTGQPKAVPTQAGRYEMEIILAETDHYAKATDSKTFVISKKEVTVSGIKAFDKEYDGKKTAYLDFSDAVWTGLETADESAITQALKRPLASVSENGFISYKAEFAGKDVSWGRDNNHQLVEEPVEVTIESLSFKEPAAAASGHALFDNYEIRFADSQKKASAKILPKTVSVSGIRAEDKVYNGSKNAELILSDVQITGMVEGEKLRLEVEGEFDSVEGEVDSKDVRLDPDNKPAPKPVKITYDRESLVAANNMTNPGNYKLKGEDFKNVTATITPARLTVSGVRAVDKTYDGTTDIAIDWTGAKIEGVCAGDVVLLGDNSAWSADSFETADVEYNKYGEVIDKTGSIPKNKYEVLLAGGNYKAADYVTNTVLFSGKILPKTVRGIHWEFDEDAFEQVPVPSFEDNAGFLEGQDSVPVWQYFRASDTAFENPITQPYMGDNEDYVARVMSVSDNNYCVDPADQDVTFSFTYDSDVDDTGLAITNYQRVGNQSFSIVYGESLPKLELSYTNSDIDSLPPADREGYFTYTYTGRALDGTEYADTKPPVNAGTYKVTVQMEGTQHFAAGKAVATFEIKQRPITIVQGVKVEDKIYNGTDKAVLDFGDVVFDDIAEGDEAALKAAFSKEDAELIRYNATYEQKDVKYKEVTDAAGEAKQSVTSMQVTAGGYSFIYSEDTPAILYNYTIAKEGNVSLLYGRINPRPVMVTGISAMNKYYDGTDEAVIDVSGAAFAGKLKGDVLTADVTGSYQPSGQELGADVVLDRAGIAQEKQIRLKINEILSGDGKTVAGNYCVGEESQQSASAKIVPRAITIQRGLEAQDKTYNGTTAAAIDFSNAEYEGIIGKDSKTLNQTIMGSGSEHITYNADFASKDVAYESDGSIGMMVVKATDYGFILNDTTPQIMKNYVIAGEGNQTKMGASILPREITISGIKGRDKAYDGTNIAYLNLKDIVYNGKIKEDVLDLSVKGVYEKTGSEAAAKDVLITADGKVLEKKITLTIDGLLSGDGKTKAGNYILAKEGQQKECTAKIEPAALTAAVWTFDKATNLPHAAFDKTGGLMDEKAKGSISVSIYEKADATYQKPLKTEDMKAGQIYVARLEAYAGDTNHQLSDALENPIYTFAYGSAPAAEQATDPEPDAEAKQAAALALNNGLASSASKNKITFRWGQVSGADGYLVYVATGSGSFGQPVRVTGKNVYTYAFGNKGNDKSYRIYTEAYKVVNGKEVILAKSAELSVEGVNSAADQIKKITVKKKSLKVARGKSVSSKASVTVKRNGKKVVLRGKKAGLVYWSTNPKVARVSKNGKIKGISKGKCTVYAMAKNGKKKKIKITVR